MAFTTRLLSRSRKFSGAQVILQHEQSIRHFFTKEAATIALPTVIGDEISDLALRRAISSSFPIPSTLVWKTKNDGLCLKHHIHRFSMMSDASDDLIIEDDFFHFIKSAFDKHKGPNYCWLNKEDKNMAQLNKGGSYLVLVGVFFEDAVLNCRRERIVMFERVKLLQQRYPSLQVFGFQSSSPAFSLTTRSRIVKTIMEEYISFPVLLSEKEFLEMSNVPCYLLFEDFKAPLICHGWDIELEVIFKDLEEFNLSRRGSAISVEDSIGVKANQVINEPWDCSPFKNLLLYYPSCISADDQGNRLFLSDTNHHRIIITDGDGKIVDCNKLIKLGVGSESNLTQSNLLALLSSITICSTRQLPSLSIACSGGTRNCLQLVRIRIIILPYTIGS
uniref:Putative ATP synthase subunit, mitochondrial n=1 Tax=Anthurium amnicola TaxID=1678845 RepID=A0A1D1YEQ4_9ARAE